MDKKIYIFNARSITILYFFLFTGALITACNRNTTPKPRGYFRIDLPLKSYQTYQSECNYRFEYPVYGEIRPFTGNQAEPCWIDIEFPAYRGTLHLTYKSIINKNLVTYVEDIRTLAYKHLIKADDIIEKPFYFPEKNIYGMIYDIQGNTASSLNFFITDSTNSFVSGSLYFNVPPNKDSLAPVIRFFTEDIEHMIHTFEWN